MTKLKFIRLIPNGLKLKKKYFSGSFPSIYQQQLLTSDRNYVFII